MLLVRLLFYLNLADAWLTLLWVKLGFASEGNHLMAYVLNLGDGSFIAVKICIGLLAASCFYQWRHYSSVKLGLKGALAAYLSIFAVHIAVGVLAVEMF
jgi:hypothetical protein